MKILTLEDIKARVDLAKIISLQEEGLRAYSAGTVDVPPVGYLKQDTPPGSYHIKYGLMKDDPVWVLKIAGGPSHLPLKGMMLVFSTGTGEPEFLLEDQGYLTQLRTAVAGLIAAKHLAPKTVSGIGVLGTGEQARLQVSLLRELTDCRNLHVWGRHAEKVQNYQRDMEKEGFHVTASASPAEVAEHCNLIVTTTSSRQPLLKGEDIRPGTHITAMGADEPGKIELDPDIIARAHILVVDSKLQCLDHGEIATAYKNQMITEDALLELGTLLTHPERGRSGEDQITVADLTGVAVQDIQIAKSIVF